MELVGLSVAGFMMLLRIHALYQDQTKIVFGVAALLALRIGIYSWWLASLKPVVHTNRNIVGNMHSAIRTKYHRKRPSVLIDLVTAPT
ncbi:hypothetical protein PM082_022119 [Marasmius tenuissimus]|nr:hypothetical protein PM082_022119 [Marasmius tenuissimus]